VNCEVQLAEKTSSATEFLLSASDPSVHVPATVAPRAKQSSLSFQAIVDEAAPGGTISIRSSTADETAEELITITPKLNRHTAAPSTAAESAAGPPVIRSVTHAAGAMLAPPGQSVCAPGSLASVDGSRLSSAVAADPSGESRTLAGTRVAVNGEYPPIVYSSPERVVFVCPSARDGRLSISVETEAGPSAAASAPVSDSAPGIFTMDSSGQAAATIFDGARLAMARNYRYPSQPAQPGDALSISVTGLSVDADAGRLSVSIGGLQVPVDEVSAVPGWAGVKRILITIPVSAPTGDAVPLGLTESLPDGRTARSQSATIAIETVRQ
jgi:uncharacterized protein (TIGR03437 family)